MRGAWRSFRWSCLVAVLLAVAGGAASAQSVVNPTSVEFEPSADHDRLGSDGRPLVESYSLSLYLVGATVPFETVSLGKPSPGTDGFIRLNFLSLLSSEPVPGVAYEARVTAVGSSGSSASAVSNYFSFELSCSYALSASSQSFVAGGGAGSVAVAAAAGCAWTASTSASWITVTGGAAGTASGTVTFTVAPNTGASQRSAVINIAGQIFTVTQAGVSCSYSITPISHAAPAGGGPGSVSVSAAAGCAWTASSGAGWITLSGATSGAGAGSVAFAVSPNIGIAQRSGTVTIAGQSLAVTQAGAACSYALTPSSQRLPGGGGNASFSVSAQAGCSWSAATSTSWITLTGATTGTGSGTVTLAVAPNGATSERVGAVTVGGQTFTVTEEGVPCSYSLSPSGQSIGAGGGSGAVSVGAQAGCNWSASSTVPWITLSRPSGTGPASLGFTVAPNTSVFQRTGTIVVEGRSFTVTQAGVTCTFTLAPASQSVGAAAGTGSMVMTAPAGCAWAASSSASWLVITGSGTGDGTGALTFSVSANPGITNRTATITAGGQSGTVVQAGAACSYAIDPVSQSIAAAGGSGGVSVTAQPGCGWTAATTASWLTVTGGASGSGDGTVAFTATANPGGSQRSAIITIAGRTMTVTQAGTACTYSLSPVSQSVSAAGGPGTIPVSTLAGCAWSATSSVPWISVTGGATGTGPGTVSIATGANASALGRTGTVIVAGQVFTVTQAGVSCAFAINPGSYAADAGGGAGSVMISAAAGDCAWTATSGAPWIGITSSSSGSGPGAVAFSVAPNSGVTARTAGITVAGQAFTVTQQGASCAYTLTPASQWLVAAGGSVSFAVSAQPGCAWAADTSTPWVSLSAGVSGIGSGTVVLSVVPNSSSADRVGTVTVGGQTFTLMQEGVACSYSVSPASQSVAAGGASGAISVTAPAGCAWSAASAVPWTTVSGAGGTGNGSVGFTVAPNTTVSQRSGTVTVAGRAVTIVQSGVSCAYSVAPSSHSVGAAGGNGSIAVTAQSGCAWAASSSAAWLVVTGSAGGDGSGAVTFSVAANPGIAERSATITTGGRTTTVTQAGAACSYAISSANQSIGAGGGSGTVSVAAQAGCGWTAASNAAWLTLVGGASGSGNGTASFSATANSGGSARTAVITVGGQTLTVSQAGASCSYALVPVNQSMSAAGGLGTITVMTAAGCAWSASSNVPWIAVTGNATGTGMLPAIITVAANTSAPSRVGTVTVAGLTYTLTQAGTGCTYALSPSSYSMPPAGGNGSVDLTVQAGCGWTAASNAAWLTVTGSPTGAGGGTVTFNATPNPGASQRTATLTIGGRSFTVTQAGTPCTYAISPVSQSIIAAGGGGTISMAAPAGCSWSATSNAWWIELTSTTGGTGNGTVTFSAAFNGTIAQRTGTITVGGQSFSVTQVASSCSYIVAPLTQSLFSSGGNASVAVTTQASCAWNASTSASWITLTGSATGSGSGTVTFSAAPNTGASQRSGTVTVAGQNVSVAQGGTSCTSTLSPASQWVAAGGGSASVLVTPQPGCGWTASSNASWITITGGFSGTAAGTVTYTVAANTAGPQRTGTISAGGRIFTVTQPGTACSYSLTPVSQSMGAAGGLGTITVSTPLACSWTAVSNVPWIAVTGGAAATGGATAILTVAANTSPSSRTGTVTVAGRTFTLTQAAAVCTYSLSASTATAPPVGATGSFSISTLAGCTWTATSGVSWITVNASGSGAGTVSYTVAPNRTTATRTGTVVAGGRAFTITQTYVVPPSTPKNLRIVGR